MFKRIALTLTFVAALMTAGLSFTAPAQAWRGYYGGGPYVGRSYYYGPPRGGYYYAPYRPYRSYAYYGGGPYVVAPAAVPYYAPAPYYYGGPSVYYGSPGVSVSVGL